MKDLYVLYRGVPTYKRALIRRVSWWLCHWRNCKFNAGGGHWNIQLFIAGTSKSNGQVSFRLFNRELELGW